MPTTEKIIESTEKSLLTPSVPEEELRKRTKALDNGDAVIFKNPEECTAAGYNAKACEDAAESARNLAGELILSIECLKSLPYDNVALEMRSNFNSIGNDDILGGHIYKGDATERCPKVKINAFEVGAGDLSNPVPLKEVIHGLYIRPDKQHLHVENNKEAVPVRILGSTL